MYQPFFGLKQAPFSIAPDPRYLFMSERHREALGHLLYGLAGGGGFVLLSGEIGAGKTTVCRCFLEQVPKRCNVAYIYNPKLTVVELMQTVCEEFRIPVRTSEASPATLKHHVDALNEFLLRTHAVGQMNVLVIDEAQNLSTDVLEQLRLLTNLETNERKLLQIILIGQPELREMLARPELEQLAQRVVARFHLGALSAAESNQYIAHRLAVAGLQGPSPFDAKALQRIHQLTGGVPRRVNLLCDRAMLGAYATGQTRIGTDIVETAASEVFDLAAPLRSAHAWRQRWLPWGLGAVGGAVAAALVGLVVNNAAPRGEAASATVTLVPAASAVAARPASAAGPGGPASSSAAAPAASPAASVAASAVVVAAATAPSAAASAAAAPATAASRPNVAKDNARKDDVRAAKVAKATPSGTQVVALARQFAALDGTPSPAPGKAVFDAALRSRVRLFQASQGLEPDGLAGPATLKALQRALGPAGPALAAPRTVPAASTPAGTASINAR